MNKQLAFVSGPKPQAFDPNHLVAPNASSESTPTTSTRWGSIGRGSTISHGSGYGVGGCGGHHWGRPTWEPTFSIGEAIVQGTLDNAIVRRYIKRNAQKLGYCYEKQLIAKPKIAGTLTAKFTITRDGNVMSSTADGVDPVVAKCVADTIKDIEFPKLKAGVVVVELPFRLASNNLDDLEPIAAGRGSASSSPSPPATPANIDYVAGATNPLRLSESAIADCLRKQSKAYGVMVVDLGAHASAFGESDSVRACITDVANTIKEPTVQRCSFAFGTMSLSDAPAIEITANAITWNGQSMETTSAVVAETSEQPLPELYDAIVAFDKATRTSTDVVAIRGPEVIRPIDTTPMKVIRRILTTTYSARIDFVLAAQRGNEWRPLRLLELPVVPVPIGTGDSWNGHISNVHHEPPFLLLVTKTSFVVDQARGRSRREFASRDWNALAEFIKVQKATLFRLDNDIAIGAEDDVPYADLVHAIDIAASAGFTQWIVDDERSLAN